MFAVAAAWFGAVFVVLWKVGVVRGEEHHAVLVMLLSAALFNTAVAPLTRRKDVAPFSRTALGVAVALAVLTLVGNLASAAAISRLSAPLFSTLQRVEVILVALMAWVFIGERVDGRYWLGAAVAGVGLWIVQGLPAGAEDGVRSDGLLYGLGAASAFAGLGVLTRKYIRAIEPATVNAMRLWLSVAMWLARYGAPPALSHFELGWTLPAMLAGVAGPGLARLCLIYSARHIEARLTAITGLATPVLALLLAFVFLGGWPTSQELVGGAIMLSGIALPVLSALHRPVALDTTGRG